MATSSHAPVAGTPNGDSKLAQLLPRPRGDAVAEAAALPASDGLLILSSGPAPPFLLPP